MEENIISKTAIGHGILESLDRMVKQVESTFGITASDIEKYNKEKEEIENRLRELTEERNKLLTRLQKIEDEIKEMNLALEKMKQKISKEILSSKEFRESVEEIIALYNKYARIIPEEEIKIKYPNVYNFVKTMSKLREFEVYPEPMYAVMERGTTRTADALRYYFVTNYKYAQTGSSKRITLTEAAKRYGIRTSTLSATIAKLLKKGKIVKVYDPITKKQEYEIKDATTKSNNTYYRDLSWTPKVYERFVRKLLSR